MITFFITANLSYSEKLNMRERERERDRDRGRERDTEGETEISQLTIVSF